MLSLLVPAGAAHEAAAEDLGTPATTAPTITVAVLDSVEVDLFTERAALFERDRHCKVNIVPIKFAVMLQEFEVAAATKSSVIDVLAFPPLWLGRLADAGLLAPVPPKVQTLLKWDELLAPCRSIATVTPPSDRRTQPFAVPIDGDCHLLYYRRSVVEDPVFGAWYKRTYGDSVAIPATWHDFVQFAKRLQRHEEELQRGFASPLGVPLMQNHQAVWFFLDIYASYLAPQSGTVPLTLDRDAFIEALDLYRELYKLAPSAAHLLTIEDVREQLRQGRYVFAIDWADVGAEYLASRATSDLAVAPLPRARLSSPPYLAFGGWLLGVNNHSKQSQLAWDFVTLFAAQELGNAPPITERNSWINPYRPEHLDANKWVVAPAKIEFLRSYLGAIRDMETHPAAVLDSRDPRAPRFYQLLDHTIYEALLHPERTGRQLFDDFTAASNVGDTTTHGGK